MGRWIGCVIVVICLVSAAAAKAAAPLLWVRNGTATPQAQELRRVLGEAERFGLSSASYRSELTDAQLRLVHEGGADAELLQRYDRDLTRLASRFTSHLRYGRVKPRSAGFDLPASAASMTDAVAQLADSENVEATLAALEPAPLPYRMLKQALARYRQLAKDESFEPLPALPGRSLRAGDSYAGAPWLRQRLALLGDLPADADPEPTDVLDETLVEGLKSFQSRHGLAADGILGKQTLAALNVPLRKRVQQIELSMERWRWLSEMPRPDIVVDVPHFMLHALPRPDRPGEQMLEMPVIVGRTRDRTPVFFASIDQVVFNPYWDVPTSILRNELLPKIRKDVDYLRRNHFEIVQGGDNGVVHAPTPEAIAALAEGRFRLRQRPGPDNALGPVKFIMSNPYGIRLHGTPEPDLFRFPQRTFSHGCIRVSDPAALAEYVLANADGEWDSTAVENAMCGTEPRRVVLRTPVRVLVFYATAAATRSRGVLFAPDVYGLDARLLKLLAALPAS